MTNFCPDWSAVRNHVAFRAEKSLGSIAWGRTEADVYIMKDCCKLTNDVRTKPKLSSNSMVKQCTWPDCDAYMLNKSFAIRHILLKHLVWPSKCHRCRCAMDSDLASHGCVQSCSICQHDVINSQFLTQHYYSVHSKFYCQLCETLFSTLGEMKSHIILENQRLVQSCMLCKYESDNFDVKGNAMYEHMVKYHGPGKKRLELTSNTKISSLDDTEKTGDENTPQLLNRIIQRVKPGRHETYQFDSFKCPHCGKLFSARAGLKIHGGIAHRKESIVFCPRCPETYTNVDQCKKHVKEFHAKGRNSKNKDKNKKEVEKEKRPKRSAVPTNVPVEPDGNYDPDASNPSFVDDDSNNVCNDSDNDDDIQDNVMDVMEFSEDDNFESDTEDIAQSCIKKEKEESSECILDEPEQTGALDPEKPPDDKTLMADSVKEEDIEEMTSITIVEHQIKREPESTPAPSEPPKKKKKPLPGLLKISSLSPGTATSPRVSPTKEVAIQIENSKVPGPALVRKNIPIQKKSPGDMVGQTRVLNLGSGKSVLLSSKPTFKVAASKSSGNVQLLPGKSSGNVQVLPGQSSGNVQVLPVQSSGNVKVLPGKSQVSTGTSSVIIKQNRLGFQLNPGGQSQINNIIPSQASNSGIITLAPRNFQQSQSGVQVATSQATVHVLGSTASTSTIPIQTSPTVQRVPIQLSPGQTAHLPLQLPGQPTQVAVKMQSPGGQMTTQQFPVHLAPGQQSIRLIQCNPSGNSQGLVKLLNSQGLATGGGSLAGAAGNQIQLVGGAAGGKLVTSSSSQIQLVGGAAGGKLVTSSSNQIQLVPGSNLLPASSIIQNLPTSGAVLNNQVITTSQPQPTSQTFQLSTSQGPVRVVKTMNLNSGSSQQPGQKVVILQSSGQGMSDGSDSKQPEIVSVNGNQAIIRPKEIKTSPKTAGTSRSPSKIVLVEQKSADHKGMTEDESEKYNDIMSEKVALNLPVVMTKRNNAKIAQDNPCLEIFMKDKHVWGKCRVCKDTRQFSLKDNQGQIEKHFITAHRTIINVHRRKLFYEMRFEVTNCKYRRCFLCAYCGKEFTTKFNVRRHQMLYCPRKDEIDPLLLGLRPGQSEIRAANKVVDFSDVAEVQNVKDDDAQEENEEDAHELEEVAIDDPVVDADPLA